MNNILKLPIYNKSQEIFFYIIFKDNFSILIYLEIFLKEFPASIQTGEIIFYLYI